MAYFLAPMGNSSPSYQEKLLTQLQMIALYIGVYIGYKQNEVFPTGTVYRILIFKIG